ncbi:MAG: hypothetical protein ACYCOX_10115, partial [Acidobacteriaceae bacterium]
MLSQSALAQNITVASPIGATSASSPVWVRAHNVGCNGLSPVSFGYSIDNSSTLTLGVTAYDIDVTNQTIGAGRHTVHFKSWTRNGLCQVVNTTFTVEGPTTATVVDTIPSNAVSSGDLDAASNWEYEHDLGTPGESRGSTVYPATTPSYDNAREFYMTYSDYGGQRYHLSFGSDSNATHFVYDTYIYFVDPSHLENVEMDMNQVMSNGETVIFGTQCASGSKTWEFTTIKDGSPRWSPSNIPCNPKTWAANTWHHVQIASHRDSNGVVTYDWVNLDGTYNEFQNASGASVLKLGWELGDLLINFQLDGNHEDNGSITAFLHKTNI